MSRATRHTANRDVTMTDAADEAGAAAAAVDVVPAASAPARKRKRVFRTFVKLQQFAKNVTSTKLRGGAASTLSGMGDMFLARVAERCIQQRGARTTVSEADAENAILSCIADPSLHAAVRSFAREHTAQYKQAVEEKLAKKQQAQTA